MSSQPRFRYLRTDVQQGVLVLTPTPTRLEGDAMADALTEEMRTALAQAGTDKVVVNLEHVEFLTSAAFRPLLALRRQLQADGGRLVLCNLCQPILEVFDLTRLISSTRSSAAFFDTQPDVAAAVASLAKPAGPA